MVSDAYRWGAVTAILEDLIADLMGGDGDLKTFVSKIQYTPTTILGDKDGNTIGDGIVGSPNDLNKVYKDTVNSALKTLGKAELK